MLPGRETVRDSANLGWGMPLQRQLSDEQNVAHWRLSQFRRLYAVGPLPHPVKVDPL